jgi:hypothetical protein
MRWAQHVAYMGEERKVCKFWWESQKEKDHLEDQGINGRMGSEWFLRRLAEGGCEVHLGGSGVGQVEGSCEHGD